VEDQIHHIKMSNFVEARKIELSPTFLVAHLSGGVLYMTRRPSLIRLLPRSAAIRPSTPWLLLYIDPDWPPAMQYESVDGLLGLYFQVRYLQAPHGGDALSAYPKGSRPPSCRRYRERNRRSMVKEAVLRCNRRGKTPMVSPVNSDVCVFPAK
jgi:hypothetical protein